MTEEEDSGSSMRKRSELRTSSCSSTTSKKSDDSSLKNFPRDKNQKVQFKDFDIIEAIGEGSFGRVFKGRKKDDG